MLKVLPILIVPMLATLGASGMAEVLEPAAPAGLPLTAMPAEPPPLLIKPLSRSTAVELNRAIPFSDDPTFAAQGFRFVGDKEALARARECLTSAIYYEAANQDVAGQQAVAQVILNRVRHPTFPATVCGTVYQGSTRETGCQFSFTCDGSLLRAPDRRGWSIAQKVADWALSGGVFRPVGLATHYHANYVVPYWATSLAKRALVGTHIFYAWPGGWGRPAAFRQRYARSELDPSTLRLAALVADGLFPRSAMGQGKNVLDAEVEAPLELAGVIAILASEPTADAPEYEQRVRSYFGGQSSHLAVLLVRSLSGGQATMPNAPQPAADLMVKASLPLQPAAVAGIVAPGSGETTTLASAARDFSARSDFPRFFRANRGYYKLVATNVSRAGDRAAAEWEAYTGAPVAPRKVPLAVALTHSDCVPAGLKSAARPVFWASASGADKATVFAQSDLGRALFTTRGSPRVSEPVKAAVIGAVFTRIEALSRSDGGASPAKASGLTALLAKRLQFYERNRSQYPTLADFLPKLIAGLTKGSRDADAPFDGPKVCGRPGDATD